MLNRECNVEIKNLFNVKDPLPDGLHMHVMYKFSCASCNACYVGETSQLFSTSITCIRHPGKITTYFAFLAGYSTGLVL